MTIDIHPKFSPSFSKDLLSDDLILVTGGLGALGVTLIEYLLGHQAKVAINDILDVEIDLPPAVKYYRYDLTVEENNRKMFDDIQKDFSRYPNIVICHAGVVHSENFEEIDYQDWKKTFDLNVHASFLTSREAYRIMAAHPAGKPQKIIFTSSWVYTVPWPSISAYTASKAGQNMLMRALARESADKNILVNAMAPGIVGAGMAKKQWDTEPDYRARAEKAIPLGYLQTTDSVAESMLFLCSPASNYMTGATLLVDGGSSLYPMI